MTGGSGQSGHLDLTKAMTDKLVTHQNVRQELVIITVDKLKLCLIEHKEHLASQSAWLGPAGVFLALVTTLVAADFHNALGLLATDWHAIFVTASFASGAFTVWFIIKALRSMKKSGLDHLIDKIADRSAGSGSLDPISAAFWDALANTEFLSPQSHNKK